jgi:hypothetical protein
LGAELSSVLIRHTVRIGEQAYGPIDIKVHPESFSKPLSGVERDVVQCMQFADDHGLDQLIDAIGATRTLVMFWVVDLVDEIARE